MRHWKKVPKTCCEPGCNQPRHIYARCPAHFRKMDPQLYARLRKMTRAARAKELEKTTAQPTKAWEFEPSPEQEAELMAKYGAGTKEREKKSEVVK
jgi:hypothetical protein